MNTEEGSLNSPHLSAMGSLGCGLCFINFVAIQEAEMEWLCSVCFLCLCTTFALGTFHLNAQMGLKAMYLDKEDSNRDLDSVFATTRMLVLDILCDCPCIPRI